MKKDDRWIFDRCEQYLIEEPDQNFQGQIKNLMADTSANAILELRDRMSTNLTFGTAGLRAIMEAGYNRMNLVSVYRVGFAVGAELLHHQKLSRDVVIGFDGRNQSHAFAIELSTTLRSMGLIVHLFAEPIPTPLCAYAAKILHALAAVMVTASHNPARDNGIKLFFGTSAQAHGPFLKQIESRMKDAPLRGEFHQEHGGRLDDKTLFPIGEDVAENYFKEIKSTQLLQGKPLDRAIKIAYTPLHGVGKKFFLRALAEEGYHHVAVVEEQAEPDGSFSTVLFPNPEEANTLDLAHQLAEAHKSDAVLANDPDADRLQVSCPDDQGIMRKLSGNEIGVILGYFAILRAVEMKIKPLVASSIVSSRMLKAVCAAMNAQYVDALTGFSNIVQTALCNESEHGTQLIFAYEEAIGFLIGRVVLDKDGVHAGVRFMEILSSLKQRGMSIWQLLDDLYLKFGLFVNTAWSKRFDGSNSMDDMRRVMENVRKVNPLSVAKILGQSECNKFDLTLTQEHNSYVGLRSDVVIFEIEHAGRIIVRPSGTEPKIKFYLELWDRVLDGEMLAQKKANLQQMIVLSRRGFECLFG